MSRNPMLAIGFAASLALGVGAAQAQTSTAPNTMSPNSTSQPSTTSPSSSSGGAMNSGATNGAKTAKATKAQKKFLDEAIEGDLSEVKVGQLAQQNGESQDVKQFGQTLQQDHGQHLQQAQQMAQQMGVTPPTEPNAKQKRVYERLSKEHGARFDKAFARAMVTDHKQDIAKYEREAKSKGPLSSFAQQTIPTLQKHLRMAEQIENKGAAVGSGATSK
jgi:putative membrane protein